MLMPSATYQREFWNARRGRFARPGIDDCPPALPRASGSALRVRIGHGLIGVGSWLSGERVAPVRRPSGRVA